MSSPVARPSTPIADLTYRSYDGPLETPIHRWWAITRMSIRLSVKKKGFWIWSAISAYWYVVLMAVFYFVDNFFANQTNPLQAAGRPNPFFQQLVWKDQFVHAFSISQLLLFIVALLVGAGTIANDNRANALLVYLSKPCTKVDYLIGKWVGIFIPITLVTLVPMLLFYGYCLMSFRDYGFLRDEPLLILKLLFVAPISGFFHASIALGISSLFNQGRLAGATYAGVYFITLFLSKAMQIIHLTSDGQPPPIVHSLFYASVDGIQIGLAKAILGTDGGQLFPMMNGRRGQGGMVTPVPQPELYIVLPIFLALCAAALWLAWSRVRAVEVVD